MQLPTFATLGLLLSLPLATVAQGYNDPNRCQSDGIETDTDKELSIPVDFNETTKTYSATLAPGSINLVIPQLNITHDGGFKRLFCLASEPDTPRAVSCFMLQPHSRCGLPDYFGKPFRLDTYKR
ncbi:hypothetical protein C8035_v010730 [Colletotrichum spinosum]|uniref:Uncharacterized protein n=1 Tax=Colletotrichum spinosum TaxID=1347390 RepID=A0A4V3HS45_9PEZI|nr:hypothetical protein C8035_v010730 [Colletotrichum spinosum]